MVTSPQAGRRPGGGGSLSQAEVNAGREPGGCGDALQQRDEPGLLGVVQCGEQFGVVFVGGVLGSGG